MTWAWDAPTGVYKDHALSQKIRMNAVQRMIFARFVRPEPGYGKGKGQSITITRILQLGRAARIEENDGIPVVSANISTKSVTVSLWGVKMELTEFEENLTYYNLRNRYQQLLRNNIELTVDGMIAEAMVASPVKFIPTSGGGVFDTDGTPSTLADANWTIATIQKCRDNLVRRKKMPLPNGRFVAVMTVTAARGLRNDTVAATWFAQTSSQNMRTGGLGHDAVLPGGMTPTAEYMGRIENVDCYEINPTDATFPLTDLAGSSTVCGEGLVFGDDAAFLAEVQKPELRAGIPQELGTKREVGWVGTMEAGLVWDDAAESAVIHVTSS